MDMNENGEEGIKQPLLPDDHEQSNEDIQSDFKSCNSGDDQDEPLKNDPQKNEQRRSIPKEASLNFSDHRNTESVRNNENNEEDKENRIFSEKSRGSLNVRLHNNSNGRIASVKAYEKPPEINLQNKKGNSKSKIFKEILDFLYFCYEFLMIMCVIGTGIVFPAIPNWVYVFLSILYIGLVINLSTARMSLTVCTAVVGLMMVASVAFLIFKIVFIILIRGNNVHYDKKLYLSLGIAVTPDELDGWDLTKSLLWDVTSVIVSVLLFIGSIIRNRKPSDEMNENNLENLKVTGARSPHFWIGVFILFTGLAGIVSPSLISLSFSILSAVGLYTWALYFDIRGPIMSTIVYIALLITAVYINVWFIIQIEFFKSSKKEWMDYAGLDTFDPKNDLFKEHVSAYAIIVWVYIISLIYIKASSRDKIKEKFLKQKNPNIFVMRALSGLKHKQKVVVDNSSLMKNILGQIRAISKNPYLHLFLLRGCAFIWIYLYFCFQSWIFLLMLFHSIIYSSQGIFMSFMKYIYAPMFWLVFLFDYVVNIKNMWNDSMYKEENYRFGIFDYNPAFPHLLFQMFTCSYTCFVLYMFRDYEEDVKEAQKVQEEKDRLRLERKAKLLSNMSSGSKMNRVGSSVASFYSQDQASSMFNKKKHIYTYEIIFRFLLKNVDILLMFILYYGGCNRIDVYHCILLILFAIYIMYPDKFRKNFILLLYFMTFIAWTKYFYVLFLPEFHEHKKLNDVFTVLGLGTDTIEGNKYGRSNLFNNNYLIVFTGYIQLCLYTSDYSKGAFSVEQAQTDAEAFGKKYPKLTLWMTVISELIQMTIPWVTYSVLIMIAILNNKSIINWVLFTANLFLLFWHISADLVTAKSHVRLMRGWSIYTLIAAVWFGIVLGYQILCLDEISNSKFARDSIDKMPDFIKLNAKIIGLQNLSDFKKIELAVKFLAYVAYFNLSVITRRQLKKSSINVTQYENLDNKRGVDDTKSEQSQLTSESNLNKEIEVKFSLVYIIYRLKKVWWLLDFIAWHFFTILSVVIMLLALYWKLSVISAIYLFILIFFYTQVPFKLQPNTSQRQVQEKQNMSILEIKELWQKEKENTQKAMIALRNKVIGIISFFTIICMSVLHLTSNLQDLKSNYPHDPKAWDDIIFWTFFAGVNYNKQDGGNSYLYEIYGFILILALCVIERKSQIWLSNKFGYAGSKYDTPEGRFKLERYGTEPPEKKAKTMKKVTSAPKLDVIEEDKEELRDSLLKTNGIQDDNDEDEVKDESAETPEEIVKKEFEEERKRKVKEILSMDYLVRILKGIRVVVYMLIVLIALIAVVVKSNIFASIIMIGIIVATFKKCSYSNLKWFWFFFMVVLMLQYLSALSNLSSSNSPSVFPTPYNDTTRETPVRVPVYKLLGDPFTEIPKDGSSEGEKVPTKWSFYLGFLISTNQLDQLWTDWIAILLLYYFFIYFYSVSYEMDINLNTQDALYNALIEIDDEVDHTLSEKYKGSTIRNNSIQDELENSRTSSIIQRDALTKREALDYTNNIKKKMFNYKIYNTISIGVSATSTIISLICLLMIAFQVQGFINLFYIWFCLYFIIFSINFIYQLNWKFPKYLGMVLKPVVICEIFIQILYQIPYDGIHDNENSLKGWQKILGFYPIWDLDSDGYPESIQVSNVVYKCFMYAFIILQENIFESEEYDRFTKRTLFDFQRLSAIKAEAMAFLYNNTKLKTTINNQFEKDKITRKLAQVNRQVKKWNKTLNKNTNGKKKKNKDGKSKEKDKKKKQKMIEKGNIAEVPENLEEDHEKSAFDDEPKMIEIQTDNALSKSASKPAEKKEDQNPDIVIHYFKDYEGLDKNELSKKLVDDRLNLLWKLYILFTRFWTNQILIVFNRNKLEKILEEVENGETKIYTQLEERLLSDFEKDKAYAKENDIDNYEDIPDKFKSDSAIKATKGIKIVQAYISLIFNILISNTAGICYLFMLVAHIMNGSLISLVYPISIFIYALLEEKRPKKSFWRFIIFYSGITLVFKFLLQTFPVSDWLTNGEVGNDNFASQHTSANDILRSMRIGLEVIVQGKNFVNYFLFEALILLSVTFHMFLQIFGGVWDEREVDKETIQEAAARIANIQKKKTLEKQGKASLALMFEKAKRNKISDFEVNPQNDLLSIDHAERSRKRSYSFNDLSNLREIKAYKNINGEGSFMNEYPIDMDLWSDIEDNFAYGGEKYEDDENFNVKDKEIERMKQLSRKQYINERKEEIKLLMEDFEDDVEENEQEIQKPNKNPIQRCLSEYVYLPPTKIELSTFVIENKPGDGAFKKLMKKLEILFTHSAYFETLFPSIKEQKPGFDLYAPMATVQCIIIIYMIFYYTRMDPDYTNVTSDDLTPQTLNQVMVIAVFIQIAIIVLDRYLYLARDYIVIDEIEIEDDDQSDEEGSTYDRSASISAFDRTKSFDIRSGSSSELLNRAMGISKKKTEFKTKGIRTTTAQSLDEIPEDEINGVSANEINLRQTKFNKTIVLKYYLQLILLVIIHVAVFWYFPMKANVDLQVTPYWDYSDPQTGSQCNEVFMNWTLIIFYLLYCLYFTISALQIRFGLPELRKGNFAMGDTGPINKGIFQGYLAAPFIVELKIVSDWTFTRTSLDLFQWIKFEGIYADLFIAKCTNKAYLEHPLGEPMAFIKKLLFGCWGLFILIVLIAGPLLIFSGFNPLAKDNFITGASLRVILEANLTDDGAVNQYELFNTQRFAALKPINNEYYKNISEFRIVRNLERRLFQQVVLSKVSDSTWEISPPAKAEIYNKIVNRGPDNNLPVNVVMIYSFERPFPAGQQKVDKPLPYIDMFAPDVKYRQQIIDALTIALDPNLKCDGKSISFVMEEWLIPTVRLPQSIKPKLIYIPELKQDIIISQNCQIHPITQQESFWWEVSQNKYTGDTGDPKGVPEGVVFFTWSEKVTEDLIGYSLIAFYAIVVLGIGRALRAVITINSNEIFIKDMPRPDSLLLICEGILISRMENNLEREEELYFILIDIMRSPEILKMISETSLKKKE